jgi:hypothetical protein
LSRRASARESVVICYAGEGDLAGGGSPHGQHEDWRREIAPDLANLAVPDASG